MTKYMVVRAFTLHKIQDDVAGYEQYRQSERRSVAFKKRDIVEQEPTA